MCAHMGGRSGRGSLGSRSSSSRHPQSDAITDWPLGPLLYRLGALHWAVRGGEPFLPIPHPPTLAGVCGGPWTGN